MFVTKYLDPADSIYKESMTMYSKIVGNKESMTISPYYDMIIASTDTSVVLSCGNTKLYLKGITNLNSEAQGLYVMEYTASSLFNQDFAFTTVDFCTKEEKNTQKNVNVKVKDSTFVVDTTIVTIISTHAGSNIISSDTTDSIVAEAKWVYKDKVVKGDVVTTYTTRLENGNLISKDTTITVPTDFPENWKDIISTESQKEVNTTEKHTYTLKSAGLFSCQVDQVTGNVQLILNDGSQSHSFSIGQTSGKYYIYGQPVVMQKIK